VRESLVASVREQLEADVPVGIFLSGGVDSNVLLAAAAEAGARRVKTFTVAFEDPLEGDSSDETAAARESARFFGTDHTEVPVRLGPPEELLDDLERFGEPFANPTVYLTRRISREARRHVKVALSGAGGDELFGGYPRYAALAHWQMLRGPVGRAAGALASTVSRLAGPRTPRMCRRAAWVAGSGLPGARRAYLEWTYYLREDEKRRLLPRLTGAAADSLTRLEASFPAQSDSTPPISAGPLSDLAMFLPENILAYTDVGSMAESLEVRVPFLDPDVAFGSLRTLRRRDLSFRRPKASLRQLFSDRLPTHVLKGSKRGFNPPLARWIRGPVGDLLEGRETEAFRRAFVDEPELHRMRELHRTGVEDFSQELLAVVMAGIWFEKWR
jgi:asparagine synthase (glutamine-hydrolysing)